MSPPPTDPPNLLSGGNPQIAKGDGDAPAHAYIAAMPGWKHDVGVQIDALVERAVPGMQRAVRWNSPFYGVEGQGWFLSYHCFTKYVKLMFFRGVHLDPPPPVAMNDEQARCLNVFEDDDLDETQLTSWFAQAAAITGWDLT